MADGRHFENRKIAISQWKIVRFWWNLVHYIRYWTLWQSRDQVLNFKHFNTADGRHIKNRSRLTDFSEMFSPGSRTACRHRQRDINCKFLKSKMVKATILKIVISPYLSEKSSNFEILYTATDFELNEHHMIKNEKVALDRLQVGWNIFLVDTYKIINGIYNVYTIVYTMLKESYFLILIKVADEAILRN